MQRWRCLAVRRVRRLPLRPHPAPNQQPGRNCSNGDKAEAVCFYEGAAYVASETICMRSARV